jgi:hypothetical protein
MNTTTLGFHGITMGTHTSMAGVQAWVAWGGGGGVVCVILATTPLKPCSSFFVSFWLFLPLLLVLCKRLKNSA